MEIRLLGPVAVLTHRTPVPTGRRQLRLMLAVLAVAAPRPVPVAKLIDRVWGDHPPAQAHQAVWTRIAGLRKVLAGAGAPEPPVSWQPGGYVLHVDPGQVDLHRFRRLTGAARRPGCPDTERVALLAEAQELWQDTPLAGLGGDWAARQRDSWQSERLDAVVAWARAALRLGRPGAVVPVLRDLADDHPHAERLTAELVRALAAGHRTGEAIAECRAACDRLRRELGVSPGPELLSLRRALLAGEPLPVPPAADGPLVVPAQLPADVAGFAGRRAEIARLDELAAERVITVSGTAGVGKTALTVHWAHRVRARFPDGQLYVNLRGFDRSGQATDPAEATRLLLDGLGVPAARVPAGLDGRAALYRSLLAGRRMLVVLDNARDAEQVRPLLPGTAGCLVLVSSRTTLTGLVAAHGARLLPLDLLSHAEARQLLAARLGRTRTDAEPAAVAGIVTACERLPLALAIAAARAAARPRLRLAVLARELRDARSRLSALSGDDPGTDLHSVLSWSYAALSPGARRLFRLLGASPGPDVTVAAAASLAGIPADRVEPLLAELTLANVLTEQAPGHYSCHALLRGYAAAVGSGVPDPTARPR
ncbi:BTAD domain-containing putative transcriptional regulator [Amycolatopsis sp. NPDC021455]|uniref:AfsR/SARP family transcriptional regulator n=1 Tax=Amycolatopsis sp. NPDC021455 TaxID=3154901 RepID=UPI0033D47D23